MAVNAQPAHPRLIAVDAARGAAIVAMIVYHLIWDLDYFGFTTLSPDVRVAYRMYGHGIAATFLALVGVGLVLGVGRSRDWPRYGRRLALIVAAAAGVSLATWFLFRETFIFFGILHCITASSLLALAFLHVRLDIVFASAGLALLAPLAIHTTLFDAPWLWWVGLSSFVPRTNDYQPLLPMFGMTLLGVGLARIAVQRQWLPAIASWRPRRIGRVLSAAGRHSLPIYLVHQPLLFGLFLIVAPLAGGGAGEEAGMLQACTAQCTATGREAGACQRGCGCFASALKANDLWRKAVADSLSEEERRRVDALARLCSSVPEPGAARP